MAAANPKTRTSDRTRTLTITHTIYVYPEPKDWPMGLTRQEACRQPRTVPHIRLRGMWLERAGFHCQGRICVEVSQGRLVITNK
jgi:hypothetical protein